MYTADMTHTGSCHCGAVRYEFEGEFSEALECNCSHCEKKGLLLYFADKEGFKLLSGAENLTEYLFNKKQIRHLSCKTCSVQAHSEGISFPKVGINLRCVDGVDVASLPRKHYNGKDM